MKNTIKILRIRILLFITLLLLFGLHLNFSHTQAKIKLKHVKLSVSAKMNPSDHTLLLYSNRILLKSEVRRSKLTLSLKGQKNSSRKLKATFLSLSKNGKKITYQLNAASRAYLCPGNGTRNGTYRVNSSLCSKSFQTKYRERFTPNILTGFVLSQKGAAVPSAAVSLFDAKNQKIRTVKTDRSGHYKFPKISKTNLSMVVQKKGYATSRITSLSPLGKTECQNVILSPATEKNLALSCYVRDNQKHPIRSATLLLKDSSNRTIFQGNTDASGRITLRNRKSPASNRFTLISCDQNNMRASYQKKAFPSANLHILSGQKAFKRKNMYSLYVSVSKKSSQKIEYQGECFHFSFSSFPSDQATFQIRLQPLSTLSPNQAAIKTDMQILLYGNFSVKVKSSPLTFRLYQKNTSSWSFLKEVSSSSLIPVSNYSCKAFLNLSNLSADTNYCLISADPGFCIAKGNYFSTKTGTATNSAAPSHQIICQQDSTNSSASSALASSLTSFCHHQIDRSLLQNLLF